jgi:glycosyltransferase involved in cell wall biosynthesis
MVGSQNLGPFFFFFMLLIEILFSTAIKAAYHIVHEFKLSSYVLHVYGSPEKDQNYTLACKGAIAEFNLDKNVTLKGLGSPSKVLPTGWIFVNSSITEGLPLALGEAGLCGLPVVCTDVGGSREVISDKKTGAIMGAVVPPSRPRQLAIGQLQVLAMTDGLEQLVDPDGGAGMVTFQSLVDAGPEALERRIMDPRVIELRERLGLMLRSKVLDVFSIKRYCREHEQILWTGALYDQMQ